MWTCPTCKREFMKRNQSHSCVAYPIENHFKGKEEVAKPLFDEFVRQIQEKIGLVKIESLRCCIHLVSSYTFSAAWALKDGIRIDFRTTEHISDPRISKELQMSPNRWLYHLDLHFKKDIDPQLINWLKIAYHLSNASAVKHC